MLWLGFGGQNKGVSPISWRGPWKCICYNIKAGSTLDSNLVLYSLVQDSSSLDILQPVLQPCFIILKGVGFFPLTVRPPVQFMITVSHSLTLNRYLTGIRRLLLGLPKVLTCPV